MINTQKMSARYASSRNQFLDALSNAKGRIKIENRKHPQTGPSGEAIFMDIGILGNPNAENLLFISSGTHGIEGYLGIELQTELLKNDVAEDPLNNTLIIFIAGVNPYGMAWHRRVNENNVDINRNFLDFSKRLPVNSAYNDLCEIVNPKNLNADRLLKIQSELDEFIVEKGLLEFLKALSGGQYHVPRGVQFGGQEEQWSVHQLRNIWRELIPGKKKVISIDLHSGLGNCGEGLIMVNGNDGDEKIEHLKEHWGDVLVSPPTSQDDPMLSGYLGNDLEARYPNSNVIATVLEYGTKELHDVFKAVIADNWLHHHGDINSQEGQYIKQMLLDAFYIPGEEYARMTYDRAAQVVTSALCDPIYA